MERLTEDQFGWKGTKILLNLKAAQNGCNSLFPKRLAKDVRVTVLVGSHSRIIYADIHRKNQHAGQTVSHMIGLTSHVLDVRCEL